MYSENQIKKIRSINDMGRDVGPRLSKTPLINMEWVWAGALAENDDEDLTRDLVRAVMTFDNFTQDNDPNGEHDMSFFEHKGETFFWKIDYYDLNRQMLSDDPADPAKTIRVLTIAYGSDY